MAIRAKLQLTSTTNHAWGATTLRFETRYDDSIPEDQRFQKATPSGHIELMIDNPVAVEFFSLGGSYYVDFSMAEKK